MGNAWVFGAPGDSQNYLPKVSRDVKAAFVELYMPLFDSLEMTIAGRHDRYDGFAGTTNPKSSLKYQQIGRAACRETLSPYGSTPCVPVSFKKKHTHPQHT